MEKEIAKRIIEIHDIIDFIDDGYHNYDIQNLIEISNELFSKLSPINQKKCQEWFDKKAKERESQQEDSFSFLLLAKITYSFIKKRRLLYEIIFGN